MRKNWALIVIVLFALLGGIFVFSKNTALKSPAPEIPKTLGIFQGNIPCADCSGITETLTLSEDTSGQPSTFSLKDLYQGKDVTNTTVGTWSIRQGASFDPTATVYVLTPGGQEHTMYYLKQGDNAVTMLDASGNKIDSPFNQTLRRIQ